MSLSSPMSAAPELADEITLGRRRVIVRCIDLPVEEVLLDPTNPRLLNTVPAGAYGDAKKYQELLSARLWDDPDVRSLYQSISANGGLIERIIVRADGVVAEGNCRTVVYNKLRQNQPEEPNWQRIPARVLPEDVSEREVAILLGELHVGGKNKWSAFEKAGHIFKLSSEFGLTQDEIAKLLKTSKTAVNHQTRAFGAMKEEYLRLFPGPSAVHKFSYFLEFYKDADLRDWVKTDDSALKDFASWVGHNKIPKGADVRHLGEIVRNVSALAAFRAQGYEAARRVLEVAQPELSSPLFKLMHEMRAALDGARLDDIQKVRKDNLGGAKTLVRDLKDSLDRFVDLCDLGER